jgi:ABC-type antimicrobial peptide transport system permease subunit
MKVFIEALLYGLAGAILLCGCVFLFYLAVCFVFLDWLPYPPGYVWRVVGLLGFVTTLIGWAISQIEDD